MTNLTRSLDNCTITLFPCFGIDGLHVSSPDSSACPDLSSFPKGSSRVTITELLQVEKTANWPSLHCMPAGLSYYPDPTAR